MAWTVHIYGKWLCGLVAFYISVWYPCWIPYMFIIVPTRWSLSGTVGMAAFCVIIGALFGVVLAAVIVVRAVWYVTMFPLSCLVRHREREKWNMSTGKEY